MANNNTSMIHTHADLLPSSSLREMLDTLDQALEDIKVANESFEDTLVDNGYTGVWDKILHGDDGYSCSA
jgi:hypothetical protein